ncbi:MAG: aromatic-ring-hydroxylating dioxygenase subunit beta [Pseudomonadota bacterium]
MDKFVLRQLVDDLNAAYADCIDGDRLEEWPAFFTDPCLYRVMPRENTDADLPLALIQCDSRGMLEDRITAHREANIYGPHCYRHVIGRAHILCEEEDVISTRTNFSVYRTWLDAASYGDSELYSVGEYRDLISVEGDRAIFVERTAVTDTSRIDSLLATPL